MSKKLFSICIVLLNLVACVDAHENLVSQISISIYEGNEEKTEEINNLNEYKPYRYFYIYDVFPDSPRREIIEFIVTNYPTAFLDFGMRMAISSSRITRQMAESLPLPPHFMRDFGFFPVQFSIFEYGVNKETIMMVSLRPNETSGNILRFYRYRADGFRLINEIRTSFGYGYWKDNNGNIIISETCYRDFSENFFYLRIEYSQINLVLFKNLLWLTEEDVYADRINEATYTLEEYEYFIFSQSWDYTIFCISLGEEIRTLSEEANREFITWMDLYVAYIWYSWGYSGLGASSIALYNPNNTEVPKLVLDTRVYTIMDHKYCFCEIQE